MFNKVGIFKNKFKSEGLQGNKKTKSTISHYGSKKYANLGLDLNDPIFNDMDDTMSYGAKQAKEVHNLDQQPDFDINHKAAFSLEDTGDLFRTNETSMYNPNNDLDSLSKSYDSVYNKQIYDPKSNSKAAVQNNQKEIGLTSKIETANSITKKNNLYNLNQDNQFNAPKQNEIYQNYKNADLNLNKSSDPIEQTSIYKMSQNLKNKTKEDDSKTFEPIEKKPQLFKNINKQIEESNNDYIESIISKKAISNYDPKNSVDPELVQRYIKDKEFNEKLFEKFHLNKNNNFYRNNLNDSKQGENYFQKYEKLSPTKGIIVDQEIQLNQETNDNLSNKDIQQNIFDTEIESETTEYLKVNQADLEENNLTPSENFSTENNLKEEKIQDLNYELNKNESLVQEKITQTFDKIENLNNEELTNIIETNFTSEDSNSNDSTSNINTQATQDDFNNFQNQETQDQDKIQSIESEINSNVQAELNSLDKDSFLHEHDENLFSNPELLANTEEINIAEVIKSVQENNNNTINPLETNQDKESSNFTTETNLSPDQISELELTKEVNSDKVVEQKNISSKNFDLEANNTESELNLETENYHYNKNTDYETLSAKTLQDIEQTIEKTLEQNTYYSNSEPEVNISELEEQDQNLENIDENKNLVSGDLSATDEVLNQEEPDQTSEYSNTEEFHSETFEIQEAEKETSIEIPTQIDGAILNAENKASYQIPTISLLPEIQFEKKN